MRVHIDIIEKKTNKPKRVKINTNLLQELKEYTNNISQDEYLFKSQRGNKPITRIQAYRILNEAR